MSKKILITGASGFIGSFLVEEGLRRGDEVWAGVRTSSNTEYLQDPRIHLIDLNFGDCSVLENQLSECKKQFGGWDYIIHNMGATKAKNSAGFERINFVFTKNFINSLIAAQVIPQKFIYMSSLSVCGPFDEKGRSSIDHEFVPKPNTAYGLSKRKSEQFLEQTVAFPYIILRPTGVYGPREKDYFLMIKTIASGFDFEVGYQKQYLSFIYVKDLVKAAYMSADSKLTNKTYFVADGKSYIGADFRMIVQSLLSKKRLIAIKLPLIFIKLVAMLSEKWANLTGNMSTLNRDKYKIIKQRNWNCDITPIQNDLGFSADYDLEKGLTESIQWYKQQKWIQ